MYGPGLKNLYNPLTNEVNMHAFVETRKLRTALPGSVSDGTLKIGNATLNTTMFTAFFMGWAAGLQYKPEFPSNCFYGAVATFNSIDYIINDFKNIKETFAWYDLVFYQPNHVMQNVLACYEYYSLPNSFFIGTAIGKDTSLRLHKLPPSTTLTWARKSPDHSSEVSCSSLI
jgi:hypothetical protein